MNQVLKSICALAAVAAGAFAQQVPRPAPPLNLLQPCKGKPVLLAFIVTTCPHCKAFARDVMEPAYEKHEACVVAIAFDEDGDTARFVRQLGLRFPVYKVERPVMRAFLGMTGADRIIGTPQVVVIDKHGVIEAQSKPEGSPMLGQASVIAQILKELK